MKPRASLTPRQNEIYEFIRAYIQKRQTAPTITEIGQRFGMRSTNGVNDLLNVLETKGYIKRLRGSARGIALTDNAPASTTAPKGIRKIPIVGEGDASNPFSIFMNPQGMISVDATMMRGTNLFAAIVHDDAMDGEGIFKGDYVVVRQEVSPEEESLVFALDGSHAIVRRMSGGRLTARNKYYKPITIIDGATAIVGMVVGVIRTLGKEEE